MPGHKFDYSSGIFHPKLSSHAFFFFFFSIFSQNCGIQKGKLIFMSIYIRKNYDFVRTKGALLLFSRVYIHKEKNTISSEQKVLFNFFLMSIFIKNKTSFRQNKKCSLTFFPMSMYINKKLQFRQNKKCSLTFFPCLYT